MIQVNEDIRLARFREREREKRVCDPVSFHLVVLISFLSLSLCLSVVSAVMAAA